MLTNPRQCNARRKQIDLQAMPVKCARKNNVNSAGFNISITDETNTKDEKARYIREAYEGFAAILGDLHEESYIHVQDVRAAAYGYGGHTQEYRYQHA